MSDYPTGLSVEEGRELILETFDRMGTETVSLFEGIGRILGEDVIAKENVPPYSRSPYDGYAFRAADLANASKEHPVTLQIIEEIPAGHVATKRVEAGQAIKILTGAPFPKGADTIEKFEVTEFTEKEVTFFAPVKEGSNVVPLGEDISIGDHLLKKGAELTPGALGILASLGYETVTVYKKPRVAIISTGDELVAVKEQLTAGKLRNSSAYALGGFLKKWGMDVRLCGIAEDAVNIISKAVEDAAKQADVVITTGGVSVGDYDCMQRVMQHMGANTLYWKTKMKPGSAFLAATYDVKESDNNRRRVNILCLSGNPSAAAVALMIVCKPALMKMAGRSDYDLPKITVKMKEAFPKKSPQRRFIPGHLVFEDGQVLLEAEGRQGNGMVSTLDGVDAVAEVPAGTPPLEAGASFAAYLI